MVSPPAQGPNSFRERLELTRPTLVVINDNDSAHRSALSFLYGDVQRMKLMFAK
jgi:hypothetical protein